VIKLSDLLGQDAVSLQTAAKNGTVKGVGIRGSQIVTVELTDRVIPATAVRSFEGDVLTYDETPGDAAADGPAGSDPRGSLVLDVHGDGLGTIRDVTITSSGQIDSLLLSDDVTIAGDRLRAIGSFAAIVSTTGSAAELPPPTGPKLG
jgi:uncharacterized protein YrrD